jgi:hypothetical protein
VALTPLRIAAAGGSVDGHAAVALVAAGFTLLQRSAPLVRALAGRRSAILLPDSAQFLVALAASDGRGAVILDPAKAGALDAQLKPMNVGAVFTNSALAALVPAELVRVLLDESPVSATVVAADGTAARVDLGSHFGLALETVADEPGRDEECVVFVDATSSASHARVVFTHRQLLAGAPAPGRALSAAERPSPLRQDYHRPSQLFAFSNLTGFVADFVAPLLAGATVATHR